MRTYETIVVGAGSSGAVISARVTERSDREVLLDVAFTLTERSLANIHGLALIAAVAKPSSTATALTKSVKLLQQDVAALEKLRLVRAQHLAQAVKVKQP